MNQPAVEPYSPFPAFPIFGRTFFDPTTFERFVQLFEKAKGGATAATLRSAVERASRWAAVDTGAIEGLYEVDRGFTFSVAAEAAVWDNLHLVKGEEVARSINDALNAYEYVLDIATNDRQISETWIKELHAVICASQATYSVVTAAGPQEHPLPKGRYKEYPNNPLNLRSHSVHSYAPVADTPAEMHRLVEELRSPEFLEAHPIVQAAYAHYAFVCIHPFADGNGRVSRALASAFLYRAPGVPLVIFADQKGAYIDALESADNDDFGPFIQFVTDRAIDVVRMITADLRRKPRVPTEARLQALKTSLRGRGGLLHEEVDALAARLLDEVLNAIVRAIDANPVAPPLKISVTKFAGSAVTPVEPFRQPRGAHYIQLRAQMVTTASAAIDRYFEVLVMKGSQPGSDFVIVTPPMDVIEEVLVRDLTPATSAALTYRIDAFADDQVGSIIDDIVAAGTEALRAAGYHT